MSAEKKQPAECRHLGGMIPTEAGPEYRCTEFGRCSTDDREGLKLCSTECEKFRSIRDRGDCLWRGRVIREDENNICGTRGTMAQIHACELHGECATNRYCDRQTTRVCLTCSDHDEPMEEIEPRPKVVMLPAQVYSCELPTDVEPTPIPGDIGTERHLVYHIWPRSGNGVWQWNVEQLLKRIDLFNGVRTIGIATGADTDSVEDVKAAFGSHRIDNWVIRDNDPGRGESVTFRRMLQSLPRDSGATFYGHAKGVKYRPANPAVNTWVELMLRFCLDDSDRALELLRSFPTVGCFRQLFHIIAHRQSHQWHFAGTHFWFRNRDVFERPEWTKVDGGYYGVELWPGRLFKASEAGCLFGDGAGDNGQGLYKAEVMNALAMLATTHL